MSLSTARRRLVLGHRLGATVDEDALASMRALLVQSMPFGLVVVAIVALGASDGGYFPTDWGWPIIGSAGVLLGIAVWPKREARSLGELVVLGGLFGLAGLSALSSLWGSPSNAISSGVRDLVYAACVAAALALVTRNGWRIPLFGVVVGGSLLAIYALATRLLPDRFGGFSSLAASYRLSAPIGYWNALGLLCVVTWLAAVALGVSARSPLEAALLAAVGPFLLVALAFTFSRGSWFALAIGLVAAIAFDPARLRLTTFLLASGGPGAIGVWFALRSSSLTREGSSLAGAAHDGHRLVPVLAALMLLAALLAAAGHAVWSRGFFSPLLERGFAAVLVAAAVVSVAALLVAFGGPSGLAHRVWGPFAAPPMGTGSNLSNRLLNLNGNLRVPQWKVAWHDGRGHPLLGSGAGSFAEVWAAQRPVPLQVKNAHNLYLETFAELGVIGLALLLAACAMPLLVGFRRRQTPGIAAAVGAFAAFAVALGGDWDWQLPAVTLGGLFIGVGVLAAARPTRPAMATWRTRGGLGLVATCVGLAGLVFLVGNMYLARSTAALQSGNWSSAAANARKAETWLPWSSDPPERLGEASFSSGNVRAARASFLAAIRTDRGDWRLWLELANTSSGVEVPALVAHARTLDPLEPQIAAFAAEVRRARAGAKR